MVNKKAIIFIIISLFFLLFSFYPTIFELQRKNNLADSRREFILEHNYYWPDYNLYLSKINQGIEGRFTAVEKYTSEIHQGSLIQEFYVALGWLGKAFNLSANNSYLLGRIILSPLLLLTIILLVKFYFKSFIWQILAFIITVSSASFPRIYTDQGTIHIGRFMEWWSNIDALQRTTFIPHILFGQVVSFYLLYKITKNKEQMTKNKLILFIILGNLVGIVFPPSLITLDGTLILLLLIKLVFKRSAHLSSVIYHLLFVIFSLPSLIYLYIITRHFPWSALVDFHRTHPMMIPFDQYILGTGPVFFLGFCGALISIVKRDKKWLPMIFWILATFSFAAFFSIIKDQSPLRFTQTGLFIPLGILGTYLFYHLYHLSDLSYLSNFSRDVAKAALIIILSLYILGNLYMMKISLNWQTTWIAQRIGANIPPVPYPPQAMYPLREWMDGIRWLKNNTTSDDVVLAEITAANHIPAYSGNTVYWGQSNTVDYDRKEKEVDQFFRGQMTPDHAQLFLKNGRIKYIFFSIQEKEKGGGKILVDNYPFIKSIYSNHILTIYNLRTPMSSRPPSWDPLLDYGDSGSSPE